MGGGGELEEYRNTQQSLETGPLLLQPELLSAAPDPLSSPNGFVVRSSALSQLAFYPKPALRKALCRPLFRTSFLPAGCGEFRARINGRARRLIIVSPPDQAAHPQSTHRILLILIGLSTFRLSQLCTKSKNL